MNEVKIVRLTSGEELLCTVASMDEHTIVIEDPTIIIPTQDRNIGLAPWLPYAESDRVEMRRKSVMFMVDPVAQLAEQYRSIHSKIITPNQSIVTPR